MHALDISYIAIGPEIILSITGIVILLFGASRKEETRGPAMVALVGTVAAGIFAETLWSRGPSTAFSGMIALDHLRLFFTLTFLIVGALTVLASISFIEKENLPPAEFYALLMFSVVGMMLMSAANDLVMVFLGLELSSIATYALAGYRRKDLRSNESALKYFILGSFSTAFLLYGMALLYGATGSTNLQNISSAVSNGINLITNQPMTNEILFVGVAMMIIGFGFKIAIAPFHVWTPDVYEGAPSSVTGFMAAGSKAAAFAAFLRVFVITLDAGSNPELHSRWVSALEALAILTMIIGNVAAISQTNIKRMLAYSSIAHAGYAMIGFLADDWGAVAFYMLAYSVVTIGVFTIVGMLAGEGDERTDIEQYSGIGFKSVGLSIVLLIFMLSLAGMPLTGGFMGKFLVFRTAWDKGFYGLVIVAVLSSAVSFYYYLRPMVVMFFREAGDALPIPKPSRVAVLTVLLALAGIFYLGLMPGPLMFLLKESKKMIAMMQ